MPLCQDFKSLQDRFRQARNVTALGDFDEFKKEFASLRIKLTGRTHGEHSPLGRRGTLRGRSARSDMAIMSSRQMLHQGSKRQLSGRSRLRGVGLLAHRAPSWWICSSAFVFLQVACDMPHNGTWRRRRNPQGSPTVA